jgi:ATP:corrinoid adenosyltransferase
MKLLPLGGTHANSRLSTSLPGHGKGKTTAALGLALRARVTNEKRHYTVHERPALRRVDAVKRLDGLITSNSTEARRSAGPTMENAEEHRRYARRASNVRGRCCYGGSYPLVVLDEIVQRTFSR